MLRGAPQASAQDNKQQKQKKRLSFREPEVEGPQRNYFYGAKSKTLARPATKPQTNARKTSASVEDLTLEDQALQIAQDVGSAFSDLTITDSALLQADPRGPDLVDIERETEITDSSPTEFATYQRNCQLRSFKITAEDEEFLDSLVSPLSDSAMRGPSFESGDHSPDKNGLPYSEPPSREEERPVPSGTSVQHQVQLLRYQLEQQNQQTQMAMHQIQLLQDRADAESAARKKAQEQNNQLMQQNKELLNHMEKLFQQIEELERQVQILEQEKRGRRVATNPDSQIAPVRQTSSYAMNRRPSSELTNEKPTMQARSFSAIRKNSLTSTKPLSTIPKISTVQNPTAASLARKTPNISSKPSTVPSKFKDSGTKEKETLRIGDTSPPVQSGTTSPFSSAWRIIKSPDNSAQSNADKTGDGARSRTGSFSSYTKKPQESGTAKSTLFGSSSLSSTSITSKKHSSSTSDLYNPPSSFQGKSSLMIDEPPTSVKSAISNLSISSISKLPRYQPYTGWQRRTSLTGEGEQVSAISKDSYKSSPQTSLFNR